jgi:hypothetical protein
LAFDQFIAHHDFEKGKYVTYSASLGKPMMTRFSNVILLHSKNGSVQVLFPEKNSFGKPLT